MEEIIISYPKFLEALTNGNGKAELQLNNKKYIIFTKEALKELEKELKKKR